MTKTQLHIQFDGFGAPVSETLPAAHSGLLGLDLLLLSHPWALQLYDSKRAGEKL